MIGFVLPHSSNALLLVNPIMCVLFWLFKENKSTLRISGLVIVPLLLSLFYNLLQVSSLKPILLCVTLGLYVFIFPFVDSRLGVKPIYFYVTLIIILISQLAYVLDVSFITNLLDTFYPIEGENESMYSHMRSNVTVENMLNYRLGGLYRNPNDCARSLTLLLVSFLVLFRDKKVLPFMALSLGGVLITGSRTGAVIAILIIIAFFVFCTNSRSLLLICVLSAFIVVLLFTAISDNSFMRALDVSSGFNNSLSFKWNTFEYYINNEDSIIRILLGYLDPERFDSSYGIMNHFDSDYGYLFFNYGIIGFTGILLYSLALLKRMTKSGRVFLIILLWMVTSTVFSSYRCVFVYMLLLSLVFNQNHNDKSILRS